MEEKTTRYIVETENNFYCVEGKLEDNGDSISFTEIIGDIKETIPKSEIVNIIEEQVTRRSVTGDFIAV